MKIGDTVELTFLDHVGSKSVDLASSHHRPPIKCVAIGRVISTNKVNGHGFVELAYWIAEGENSETVTVLLDVVTNIKVVK